MPPLKKNEKIMLAAIGALIVTFIIMDPYYFIYRDPPVEAPATPPAGAKPGVPPPASTPAKPAAKSAKGKGAKEEPVAVVVDNRPKREPVVFNSWGRDPFIQAKRSYDDAQAISALKLSGISIKGKDSYALINKQPVRVGDVIEGMVISGIESDRVQLMKGGRTYTLMGGQR